MPIEIIMDKEDQVCTLEQSKEIERYLGDKAPGSLWVWNCNGPQKLWYRKELKKKQPNNYKEGKYIYPAYTGCELGRILPNKIPDIYVNDGTVGYLLTGKLDDNNYETFYHREDVCLEEFTFIECSETLKTEAQSKADLLIQLYEKGYINKPDKKNEHKTKKGSDGHSEPEGQADRRPEPQGRSGQDGDRHESGVDVQLHPDHE